MSIDTHVSYDLAKIEMEARRMRAEMMSQWLGQAFAWLRKPRTQNTGQQHTA